jgi:hypothetical protein
MASRLRIEFITLGADTLRSGVPADVVQSLLGAADLVTSTTVTVAGSRPVAPAGCSFALLRALDAPVIVAWGTNPTAVASAAGTPNDGLRLQAGDQVAVATHQGMLFSAIEVA